ncbi:rRNA biogenesis protein RRP5 isoform X2 [Prorops nasuta]|uniref:rRNA biogenesis protein RRP5 isoform X2 n=1 Tax=Prorops nasuta TaxID=863751 RepID=UPI0034CFFB63
MILFIELCCSSNAEFFPGKQVLGVIKNIETKEATSIIKVSCKKSIIDKPLINVKSIDTLMPGSKITLTVKSVLFNGLQVSFSNNNLGYINQIYLKKPLSYYSTDMEVIGILLYTMPTVKFAYFSLLHDHEEKSKLNIGDIISKAIVLYRESYGIVLKLSKNARGLVSSKHTGVEFSKIPSKFMSGSTHKCRILSYNPMDNIYICTMDRKLLEEKYFSCYDLNPGSLVDGIIKGVNTKSGFVTITVGRIVGVVTPWHVSDSGSNNSHKLKAGEKVKARVLSIDVNRRKVDFTLKPSLVKSDLAVLSKLDDAKIGSTYHCFISKVMTQGLAVKFFGNVRGFVPKINLGEKKFNAKLNYVVGQVIAVKVVEIDKDKEKLTLSITGINEDKLEAFSVGEEVEGRVMEASLNGVYIQITKGDDKVAVGFLPAGHIAPCMEVANLLASKYIPGKTISTIIFATTPDLLLTKTFCPQEECTNFYRLKAGDCILCSIKEITNNGVRVVLPINNYSTSAFIPYCRISNFEQLQVHQILFVKIKSISKKHHELELTMRLEELWIDEDIETNKLTTAIDVTCLHFNKLTELASQAFLKSKPLLKVTLGQRVSGKIINITEHGLVLEINHGIKATVQKEHYLGDPRMGDKVSGTVLWINYVNELVDVTLLSKLINDIDPNQKNLAELPLKTQLRGEIVLITSWFVLVVLKGRGKGCLVALPARRHVNDISPDLTPYAYKSQIRCYVVLNKSESDIVPVCMLKSAFEIKKITPLLQSDQSKVQEQKRLKRKKTKAENAEETPSPKRIKKQMLSTLEEKNTGHKLNGKMKKKSKKDNDLVAEEEIKDQNDDNDNDSGEQSENENENEIRDVVGVNKNAGLSNISSCGFYWDAKPESSYTIDNSECSSDESEEDEKLSKGEKVIKKKLNAIERREEERQKEREIRQREEALASSQIPSSVDDFDRLVLSSPDNSLIWLQYMAYHLQATEIEKARAVARKAIRTISFRDENERLNVWNAWLNLESKFGSTESLNNVLQEALKANDPFKIYLHMLTMHVEACRHDELDKLIRIIIAKFKQLPETWTECGKAYLEAGLTNKSRNLMQRALQSLAPTHHINVIVRYALMENKFGNKERSQTLFEQVLNSYAKRVDVWSCYIDCLIKSKDFELARKVLERACAQSLPPRKMKTLLKKFVAFEEKYGSPENVTRVQKIASEYIENQCKK